MTLTHLFHNQGKGSPVGGSKVNPYIAKLLFIQSSSQISLWPFDENGGINADDKSALSNDGIYGGGGLTLANSTGPNGVQVPHFDGSDAYINCTTIDDDANGLEGSIFMWLKVNAAGVWTDSTLRKAIVIPASGTNYIRMEKMNSNDTFRFLYQANATNELRDITISPTDWFSVAITWSDSNDRVRVYYNGLQQGADMTSLGGWNGVISGTFIGAQNSTPLSVWHGWVGPTSIWTTELTPSEILEAHTI